jgi:hypothetical protein
MKKLIRIFISQHERSPSIQWKAGGPVLLIACTCGVPLIFRLLIYRAGYLLDAKVRCETASHAIVIYWAPMSIVRLADILFHADKSD